MGNLKGTARLHKHEKKEEKNSILKNSKTNILNKSDQIPNGLEWKPYQMLDKDWVASTATPPLMGEVIWLICMLVRGRMRLCVCRCVCVRESRLAAVEANTFSHFFFISVSASFCETLPRDGLFS